mgnify:CR=1 FL=1
MFDNVKKVLVNAVLAGFWAGLAAFALAGSFLLVRRQALKESEPFWSPPTRRPRRTSR